MPVLVDLEDVSVRRGDRTLFGDLSLTVVGGDRVGVVGINGTGKSTLLRVLAGVERPDEGLVRRGRGVRVGFLNQDPVLPGGTVRGAVGHGWEAEAALDRLGMSAQADLGTSELSGGQAKRVALAAVLAHPADLLVLDEPTNHLDLRGIAWLEQWLREFRGGLVLVSHDRHLLDRTTTRMVELDRGHEYVHEGGYSAYLAASIEREEAAATSEASRRNLARRELAWLRRGAPARTRKPRARIEAAKQLISSRLESPARSAGITLSFGTPRLGDKVIECVSAGYAYQAGAEPVLSGVDLLLDPTERLGVVGPNGSGKSTLLDLLAGRRATTSGRIEVGPTVVTGYYDQTGIDLDPRARVRDLVAGTARVPGAPEDVALMERFWFAGALQFATAGALSGGERRRLQLLLVLAERPNVLLLDEPTNDLDLDTLRILEDFLEDWAGALVVVSHDRTFLERTTERLVAVEGGTASAIAGGLDGWVASVTAAGPRQAKAAVSRSAAPQRSQRSPSTVGRQLREAEKEMTRLARQRDELHEALAASGGDHVALARLGSAVADVQGALAEAETRWLALAEELEAAR
ncbi:MAG: ABC-F family ATP-binding cassette domain-containing protein [Acidimicrobiales bacterium]